MPVQGISEEYCQAIGVLRQARVLEDVQGHRLDQQTGCIFVPCSDGDRFDDVYGFHRELHLPHGRKLHSIAVHGGALRIAFDEAIGGIFLLREILDAITIKSDLGTICMYAHAPCSKYPIHPHEAIAGLIQAKTSLEFLIRQRGLPLRRIACFYHVDYGPNDACGELCQQEAAGRRFRSYWVNTQEMYYANNPKIAMRQLVPFFSHEPVPA